VIVYVSLSPVLPVHVLVGHVDMLDLGVVVLVRVRRQQVTPVLSTMQVVRDMEVLVPVLDPVVVMAAVRLRPHVTHPPHPRSRSPYSECPPAGQPARAISQSRAQVVEAAPPRSSIG